MFLKASNIFYMVNGPVWVLLTKVLTEKVVFADSSFLMKLNCSIVVDQYRLCRVKLISQNG